MAEADITQGVEQLLHSCSACCVAQLPRCFQLCQDCGTRLQIGGQWFLGGHGLVCGTPVQAVRQAADYSESQVVLRQARSRCFVLMAIAGRRPTLSQQATFKVQSPSYSP